MVKRGPRAIHGSQLRRVVPKADRTVDGIVFDSLAEVRRYGQLKLLQRAGKVKNLKYHPRLPLVINGKKLGRGYLVIDFSYITYFDLEWRPVYEDVKGNADTHLAKFRRTVAEAINGVVIDVISA